MVYEIGTIVTYAIGARVSAHEAEKARIGAGTEGDDLFLLGGIVGEELVDEVVDGFASNICTWNIVSTTRPLKLQKATTTSVNDRKPPLPFPRNEVLRKRIIQVSHLNSAQPGDTRILICLPHDPVMSSFVFFRAWPREATLSSTSATACPMCIAKAVEVRDLWCGHD